MELTSQPGVTALVSQVGDESTQTHEYVVEVLGSACKLKSPGFNHQFETRII